ncbi:MAG: hypothetical protein JF607_18190 [Burkholderiales bacterium]|jgi:hypothetical protein|nr:hypothetical protein [Burkholderiales bacterium]
MSTKTTLTPLATALTVALLAGCAQPRHADVHAEVRLSAPAQVWTPPPPAATISVYIDPPMAQPEPVLVDVAPPPMLVEAPPPPPMAEAVWVGGYWGWQGRWVWCAGRWLPPPQPSYHWTQPYYEHRGDAVVYVAGHWAPAGVSFAPPPPDLHLSLQISISGGERPIGPAGVFVPPPPGSRPGLVIPAPIGTPPAVVISAPPVVNVGMRVTNNINRNTTTVNNISHVTNITNVTNVTVMAPPTATANGQAFQNAVPAQAHLAAALPAVVHAQAPRPASATPVASFSAGHPPPTLPPAQMVRMEAAAPHGPARAPELPAVSPQPSPARAADSAQPAAEARPSAALPTPLAAPARPAAEMRMAAPEVAHEKPQDERTVEHRAQVKPAPAPPHPQVARDAHPNEMAHPQAAHHDSPAPVDTRRPPAPAKTATPPAHRHEDANGERKPPRKDDEHREHQGDHAEEAR